MHLDNATPFDAVAMPSCDRDGRDVLLIVVAASFDIPGPRQSASALKPSELQELPPMVEEYVGEPGQSSVKREGQGVYARPATDVYIWGQACAPEGQLVKQMDVSVDVGPCSLRLSVFGDRVWQKSLAQRAAPSPPEPFERIPLVWERAYGGVAIGSTAEQPLFESRNPIGCGLQYEGRDAVDQPVPNIEDPERLISNLSDRPTPRGVCPIARHWQPRVSYAGTYDEPWQRGRAPLWPTDFDERFFCGAPETLQASPHLLGGERVTLTGMHPEGALAFSLPTLRFTTFNRFLDRAVRATPVLDGVLVDAESLKLTMYYRAAVPAPLTLVRHRESLLRLLEPWEAGAPA